MYAPIQMTKIEPGWDLNSVPQPKLGRMSHRGRPGQCTLLRHSGTTGDFRDHLSVHVQYGCNPVVLEMKCRSKHLNSEEN